MWWVASRTCSTTPTWNTSTSACPAKRSAQPPSPIRRSTHRESRLTLVLSGHTRPFGVKGSGVFFGNRVFKLMRRWPKKIPDPVRLRPTASYGDFKRYALRLDALTGALRRTIIEGMTREAIFEASVGYFLSPIARLLNDDSVTEIMVNRFDRVYIERAGQLHETDARFETEDALLSAVHNIAQWVGREINQEHPILDARLPDGSRVHAIIPPGCRGGTCLTIRKFKLGGLSLDDLILFGSLNEEAREFLEICVRLRKNIIVSGGT